MKNKIQMRRIFSKCNEFHMYTTDKAKPALVFWACRERLWNTMDQFMLSSRIFGRDFKRALNYAIEHGYSGVEWYLNTFKLSTNPAAITQFLDTLSEHENLQFTFHLPTTEIEIGHADSRVAQTSTDFVKLLIDRIQPWCERQQRPIPFTAHLGSNSLPVELMDWDTAVANLTTLAAYSSSAGGVLCLENLKSGWTTNPNHMLDLVTASGCKITLDTGHARSNPLIRGNEISLVDYVLKLSPHIVHMHVYHYESLDKGEHIPPEGRNDIADVLDLMPSLPHVSSVVLELSSEEALAKTLKVVREGGRF